MGLCLFISSLGIEVSAQSSETEVHNDLYILLFTKCFKKISANNFEKKIFLSKFVEMMHTNRCKYNPYSRNKLNSTSSENRFQNLFKKKEK